MKFKFVLPALLLLGGMTNTVNADSGDMSEEAISQRIAPVGQVYLAGEEPAPAAAEVVASGPRDGATIYNSFCVACHSTGVAGAPKVGDAAVWGDRVDSKGFDQLVLNAINGIGGMPMRGTCMDCSDDEIKATVDYMIAQSQ